jgi:hypothetical protein
MVSLQLVTTVLMMSLLAVASVGLTVIAKGETVADHIWGRGSLTKTDL